MASLRPSKTSGVRFSPFGEYNNESAVAVLTGGKIVAAGFTTAAGSSGDFVIARYFSSGSLNASFWSSGMVTADFGGSDSSLALAVRSDGNLVTAGMASSGASTYFALTRVFERF